MRFDNFLSVGRGSGLHCAMGGGAGVLGGDCRRGITVWPADFYLPRFWANMIPDRIGYANIR